MNIKPSLFLLIGCFQLLAIVLTGCQTSQKGVNVFVENGDRFPECIEGTWKLKDSQDFWEFDFLQDGQLSRVAIGMGGFELVPRKPSKFPVRFDGEAVFTPGEWSITFDHESRELAVKIVVEHFYVEMKGGALEGNTEDYLIGPLSENCSEWKPDWFYKEELFANIDNETKAFPGDGKLEFRKKLHFFKSE